MKNLILSVFLIILAGEVTTLYIMHQPGEGKKVLAVATASTPLTAIASPTETPTPANLTTSPLASIAPSPKPTPTPIPIPTVSSQQINEFIDRFAGQYGVDPNVIRHIAICESGFNPRAVNYIYTGLFQFGPLTWQNIRTKMGKDTNTDLRENAEEAVETTAYAISIGERTIWPHCNP